MPSSISLWKPDKNVVSKKEVVGRRAFGDCIAGAGSKFLKGRFKLPVFYERRPDDHMSLDRLGLRKENPKVLEALMPYCIAHADSLDSTFTCWAALRMEDLPQETVIPAIDHKFPENDYHCELQMHHYRERGPAESLAFKLSTLARRVEPPSLSTALTTTA